jgi:hypothetical protein
MAAQIMDNGKLLQQQQSNVSNIAGSNGGAP